MEGEWVTRKISEIGRVVTGKTPSTKRPEYFDGKYPFITIPDLDRRRDISTSARTLSELGAETMRSCRLPADAVMMSCIATIGKCGITTRPSFTNQQINSVICGDDVDSKFLYYCFTQLGPALDAAGGGGSVYTNVSKSRFSAIEVVLPPLKEQLAISHLLGALDDKIELNRRMNETLEGMARAIFKSWFVDFDPVRAKLALSKGEGAAGQQPPGLAPHIADLFPDDFEVSELGEIPRGWEVSTLGTITNEVRDTVQPADIEPGTPYIALEHMPRRSIALNSWGVADDIASAKLRFRAGDILFGKLRPYFHKVGPAPLDGVCSTDIVVCRPQDDLWYGLTLGHMSSDAFVAHTDSGSTGTKMPRTNWRYMSAFKIVLPPSRVVARFSGIVRPMINRIRHSIFEQQNLAALRDTLLPKLISGELRVPEAERIVGRCV